MYNIHNIYILNIMYKNDSINKESFLKFNKKKIYYLK